MAGLDKLEEIIKDNVTNPEDCVFLHPKDPRRYTDDELLALTHRNFETRLFITGTQCAGDSAFLRTHFTDNAEHSSNLNYVRDYVKAFHVTKNWTCAKTVLTTLLTQCFQLSPSRYYTFATSVASGLSNNGANTDFEGSAIADGTGFEKKSHINLLVNRSDDLHLVRRKFCYLMDVIFKRMEIKKFLIDDDRSNIFRLVHCETKYSNRKKPLLYPLFSFVLQVCLTVYVILEFVDNIREGLPPQYKMIPLAVTSSLHSLTIAVYNVYETFTAHRLLFTKIGPLQMMDFIVNAIIPFVLTAVGFVVILLQPSFIEAVLDSTALLFIPEIDDQLPSILGHRVEEIVKNFLVAESISTFDSIARLKDEDFTASELTKRNVKCGVQFSDIYITNLIEQGITDDTPFQPYQVIFNNSGHQIDPSAFVTLDCLLTKIEWRYTTGYPRITKPRIGCLRLTKATGEIVHIQRKKDPFDKVGISEVSNTLEGLYIITTFQMSEDVIKLRVCGSLAPLDFLNAFDSYSLWDIDTTATKKIFSLPIPSKKGGHSRVSFVSRTSDV